MIGNLEDIDVIADIETTNPLTATHVIGVNGSTC